MPLVEIKDRSGHPLKLFVWNGYYLPRFFDTTFRAETLRDYLDEGGYANCKVLMSSYPRSGFHWLFEHINMLIHRDLSVSQRVNSRNTNHIDLRRWHKEDPLLNKPLILQTHLTPEILPDRLRSGKIVYTYRNPKDVALSLFKFTVQVFGYTGKFEDFAELFLEGKDLLCSVPNGTDWCIFNNWQTEANECCLLLTLVIYGSWLNHRLQWKKFSQERNICVLSYDDLSENPLPTLRRLSRYLEVDVDDKFLMSVHQACNIDNMRHHNVTKKGMGEVLSVVRKGVAGDWKKHFTVELSEKFDRVFQEDKETSKL